MPVETFALYTSDDKSHCDLGNPDRAIEIPSASSYLDASFLIDLVREHSIDAIHPGYGFLSESADFARRIWDETASIVIGPGWENLERTGDKLRAKELAQECGVPVLEAMSQATSNIDETAAFSRKVGFPVMVKAVDGGGGRGIRLVQAEHELKSCVQSAMRESPSNQVFLEKAAVDGFHHVEIQILGDREGQVRHLWERDCSAQRRFQKVVEFAPASIHNRSLVIQVVDSALKMARHIRYESLGTFEFLVNEQQQVFYFLEINPRLQVEHTITESISGMDLVQTQLLLAQGYTLKELGLNMAIDACSPPPGNFSIQLRLCAEDPSSDFSLSIGKVTSFRIPSGHGIRLDTHVDMSGSSPLVVGHNFDNLLAKIIVSGSTWEAVVQKARRVLAESHIEGVKTNLGLLLGIVSHPDFIARNIDTQWLGLNLSAILELGRDFSKDNRPHLTTNHEHVTTPSSVLFRKGDSWSIGLEPVSQDGETKAETANYQLRVVRVLRNEFPRYLDVEAELKSPTSNTIVPHRVRFEAISNPAFSASTSGRMGDPTNSQHITFPMSGKVIEVLVASGDEVTKDQVLAFIQQMKMEIEIRSPRAGKAKWVYPLEDGEHVRQGMLLVELEQNTDFVMGKL